MDFDYQLHVFKYPGLESIVIQAIEFFKKTPVHPLPSPHRFGGKRIISSSTPPHIIDAYPQLYQRAH